MRRPPETRLKNRRHCTHSDPYQQLCPRTIAIKFLTKCPRKGHTGLEKATSVACQILVPRPGIEPRPPAVEVQSSKHWTTREVPGTHSFEGHEPTVAPFARQSNRVILFYFTQNSVSDIRFGTSAQRPSFQHHSLP